MRVACRARMQHQVLVHPAQSVGHLVGVPTYVERLSFRFPGKMWIR
jgi:hypothetical protein